MKVLYRDEHLLAVDKPSGLAVHRGWVDDEDTALDRARAIARTHVYPAHRLDRGTSGVLLFALSSEIAARLGEVFSSGGTQKVYRAIVRGHPPLEGLVDHPVRKGEERDSPRVPARTAFMRLATCEHPREGAHPLRYAFVEARPETGRLHQSGRQAVLPRDREDFAVVALVVFIHGPPHTSTQAGQQQDGYHSRPHG